MRLLHSCVDLFILSPCLPFIYYVGALTFPGCQADFGQVGESDFNKPSCGDICLQSVFFQAPGCRLPQWAQSVLNVSLLHTAYK